MTEISEGFFLSGGIQTTMGVLDRVDKVNQGGDILRRWESARRPLDSGVELAVDGPSFLFP